MHETVETVSGDSNATPLDRLRGLTQHRDIQRQVEKHREAADRIGAVEVVDKAKLAAPITGRVLGRGLANELSGAAYLVVAGVDGKTYYAALSSYSERDLAHGRTNRRHRDAAAAPKRGPVAAPTASSSTSPIATAACTTRSAL